MEKKSKTFFTRDLLNMIAATVLGRSVSMVAISFVDDFIEPIINHDYNHDGKKDITQLKDLEVSIFNTTFKVGHFIVTLMTVVISIALLYCLHRYNYE